MKCINFYNYVGIQQKYNNNHTKKNTTSTNDNVAARLRGGHSFHRKTCEEDTEYGCCEIYYNCHIVGDSHIDYDTNNINLYKVSADDLLKSNCPSLRTLINKYNDHYLHLKRGGNQQMHNPQILGNID